MIAVLKGDTSVYFMGAKVHSPVRYCRNFQVTTVQNRALQHGENVAKRPVFKSYEKWNSGVPGRVGKHFDHK